MDIKKTRIRKEKSSEWLIENIAEASKNARKLYLLYIGFIAYCALTVVSTSDRQIILNETARLPIVNLDVPLNGFFILAPIIAIFVYIYFQLYLRLNQDLITRLKDVQPSIQKDRIYPWIVNTIEFPDSGSLERLKLLIIKISLWWLLPLVLLLFPLWFIKKHDPVLSYVVGMNPIIGTIVVIWFWYQYESLRLKGVIWRRPGKILLASLVLVFEIFFLFYLIPRAFDGGWWSGILKSQIYIDLSDQKLVSEPNIEYKTQYWLNIKGAHLEGANLTGSILKRADLQEANLKKAILINANLEGARLWDAQLQGANLEVAQLDSADLAGAELDSANLRYANLQGANLEVEQLCKAKTLFKVAGLDPELLKQIKKKCPDLLKEPKE